MPKYPRIGEAVFYDKVVWTVEAITDRGDIVVKRNQVTETVPLEAIHRTELNRNQHEYEPCLDDTPHQWTCKVCGFTRHHPWHEGGGR